MSNKMDKRCPRQLQEYPDKFCPLAVQRLKAIRHAGRELTEEEESQLPGCPWSTNHQMANYCFFKFIDEYVPTDKPLSDMEIAHLLNVSVDSVKKVEKRAINRMKNVESLKQIKDEYGGDKIMDDSNADVEWEVPK